MPEEHQARRCRIPPSACRKASPREAIERINAEVNRALSDPKILESLANLGAKPLKGTPEDFGRVIAAETAKWEKVVVSSGATAE